MSRRATTAVGGALILGLALSACSADTDGQVGDYSTDTINSTIPADPTTFIPARGTALDDFYMARLLFDTVVRRDDDNEFVGGLAETWDVSATEGTFTIRDDATCADGTEITPTIVADSLNYFADPEIKSSSTSQVFGPGRPTITADDSAGTVHIELAQPWTDLLTGLTLAQTGIMCPAGFADEEAFAAGDVEGAFSGPYVLTKSQHGVNYSLTLRDDYAAWPTFSTPLEGVPAKNLVLTVSSKSTANANELLTGTLDIAPVDSADVGRFDDDPSFSTVDIISSGMFIVFNERPGSPFADEDLRRAVAQAIDQAAYNDVVSAGRADLFTSIASPTSACVLETDEYLTPVDVDAARNVLDGLTFRFVGSQNFGPNGAGNIYVQEALLAAGAELVFDNLDNASWATRITKETDTWDFTILGDTNPMGTMASGLTRVSGIATEDGGRNIGGIDNPIAVNGVADAMSADTDDARCAALEEAQKSVLERVDAVPLAALPQIFVARDGFSVSKFSGFIDLATMRITK